MLVVEAVVGHDDLQPESARERREQCRSDGMDVKNIGTPESSAHDPQESMNEGFEARNMRRPNASDRNVAPSGRHLSPRSSCEQSPRRGTQVQPGRKLAFSACFSTPPCTSGKPRIPSMVTRNTRCFSWTISGLSGAECVPRFPRQAWSSWLVAFFINYLLLCSRAADPVLCWDRDRWIWQCRELGAGLVPIAPLAAAHRCKLN